MSLIILTGASGSGKTAIAGAVARDHAQTVTVYHFDSIGVPSLDVMIRDHGSPEAWQRDKTVEWLARLAPQLRKGRAVLLEGQMRPSFVREAAAAAKIDDYRLLLIDCDDATRAARLTVERGQPELADATMMNWAAYLRHEARSHGCAIIDTSGLSIRQGGDEVLKHLQS
ncbi:AAA family ATPase [Rhizobium lusitanum]|uniref:AAA family ATPase n=1 Tax=Rhizobium lusitanum TaxID=293958 RepID=A0A6L9U259_9HYPH|nr:AAA family ATPase [Rhizobium lusitanum]NEI69621.1 AAA family ATPase [Rhizobium lusitanum]